MGSGTKESQLTEWKQVWKDEYLKWICGFANGDGGTLLIGYDDAGSIVGIRNAQKLLEDIPNKARDTLGIIPAVNLIEKNGLEALEIIIDPSSYPVSYKGQYHFRSGSTKQELKGRILDDFILRKQGKHWDGIPLGNLKPEELDKTAINVFMNKARKGNRLDADALNESVKTLFEKLHLLDEGKLKRAAALLFHPDPERFITGAYVKIGYFRSETDLIYQDEVHGPLILQIDKTLEILTTKYLRDMISYEGIQRVEKYPYPESALREAVTNAISHKNYSGATPIQIKVFDDRISIWNDAVLPANWTVDVLKRPHPSKPYNPDIANTMFRAGMAEAWGRGTIDIINHCIDYGIREPEFVFDVTGFSLVFYAGGVEKSSEKSSEKILRLLSENNKKTITSLSEEIGISTRAIEKNIKKLQEAGRLKRIGSDRDGSWEVLN